MILVVTGSRTFNNKPIVWEGLEFIHSDNRIEVLFSGHCGVGADALCEEWATDKGIPLVLVPAMWKQGLGAGFMRNSFMLHLAREWANSCPTTIRLAAFADMCKRPDCKKRDTHYTHGTDNCISEAVKLRIRRKIFTRVDE